MLICDNVLIGNRLYQYRKKAGMTQTELAEASNLSDRAYANIERGSANMRLETLIHLCNALSITPNDLLLFEESETDQETFAETIEKINKRSKNERETALALLKIYLNSLQ